MKTGTMLALLHPWTLTTLSCLLIVVDSCGIAKASPPSTSTNKIKTILLDKNEIIEFVWIPKLELWAGKYEVTLGQLRSFFPKAAHSNAFEDIYAEPKNRMSSPAVKVGWEDARDACNILNKRYGRFLLEGYRFRLPTEHEWEIMARCGDNRKYPWGDAWPPTPMSDGVLPNLQGAELITLFSGKPVPYRIIPGYKDGWPSTAPVYQSGANEWGLYGMAGNVLEWCDGWYDKNRKLRLLKGSSASTSAATSCEISARDKVEGQSPIGNWIFWGTVRNSGHIFSGFRVVLVPESDRGQAPPNDKPLPGNRPENGK